jgi:hypothetical protein
MQREVVVDVRLVGAGPEEWRTWSVALGTNFPKPRADEPFAEWSGQPLGQVYGDRWVGFDANGKARLHGLKVGYAYSIVAARRGADGTEEAYRTIVWRTGSLPEGTGEIEWTPPRLTPVQVTTRESGTGGGVTAKVLIRPDPATFAAHEAEMPGRGHRLPEGIRTGPGGRGTVWLWPGKYTFTAYGGVGTSGDVSASADVTVGSDEGKVDLLLPAVFVVKGRIRTSAGTPLQGRHVSLWGRGQQPVHYFLGTADDTGAFEIHGVPEGTYDLQWDGARGEGLFNGPRQVAVPTDPLALVVSLCTVHGDVRPVPPDPAVVALRPPRTGEWILEPLDDTGAFEVSGLSPGEWLLEVRKPNGIVLGRTTVTVADGATLTVTLE